MMSDDLDKMREILEGVPEHNKMLANATMHIWPGLKAFKNDAAAAGLSNYEAFETIITAFANVTASHLVGLDPILRYVFAERLCSRFVDTTINALEHIPRFQRARAEGRLRPDGTIIPREDGTDGDA